MKSSNSLDSKNSKSKIISQINKLELNNQHFQIIHQKKAKIESSDNKFTTKNIPCFPLLFGHIKYSVITK